MPPEQNGNDRLQDDEREFILKVILGGSWAVGKTSLRRKYLGKGFKSTYMQTFGADFALKNTTFHHDDGNIYHLSWQIWDIAGQPTFASLRKMYIYGARAALVVFDVTRRETLEEAQRWCYEIWEYSAAESRIPIILVGNKIDLRINSSSDADILRTEDGQRLAKKLQVPYVETSAKTGENVDLAFDILAKNVLTEIVQLGL